MNLLVIGATKGIGRAVTHAALDAGHSVRAMARSADEMAPREGLEPFSGDATDADALGRAIEGMDAVVMALGIEESLSMIWQEVTLFSAATAALVPLLEAEGPDRLIAITGIGAGDSARALSQAERVGHRVIFSKPYKDKTRQEEIIRASSLRWTLIRPTILTNNRASGRYRVMMEPESWRMGMISRGDVAHYVLACLADDSTVGQAPVIAR